MKLPRTKVKSDSEEILKILFHVSGRGCHRTIQFELSSGFGQAIEMRDVRGRLKGDNNMKKSREMRNHLAVLGNSQL